ncbi:MAG: (Fe-S)-binding protein [Candidatus Brocadiia bacterium]
MTAHKGSFFKTMEKCARCGQCRSVCPVFARTLDERFVARARVTLAESYIKGGAFKTADLAKLASTCIKCSRCSWVCPSGVMGDEVTMGLAAELAKRTDKPVIRAFFRTVVMNRPLFDVFIAGAAAAQKAMKPRRDGVLRHLPLAVMGKTELPLISGQSALQTLKRHRKGTGSGTVALFLGCAINYAYPRTAQAMSDVLNAAGYSVVVPRDQLCCGTPALTMGLAREARDIAKRNCRVLLESKADFVVTGCASCALTLRRNYPDILDTPLKPRVFEFTEFLIEQDALPKHSPFDGRRPRVAYHDPCHLRYGLKISDQPRAAIRACADLIPTADEDKCCGGGGSFAFFNPELSSELALIKVKGIASAAPEAVATTCPGCMMQLREHLHRDGVSIPVVHVADLLVGRIAE